MSRAGLSPERLTRAAADLADEVGLEHVTLSALARRFEVTLPSLYSHVRGSEDLRERISLLALAELAERGGVALAGLSGKDALLALGGLYRGYAAEHPGPDARARQLHLTTTEESVQVAARLHRLHDAVLRGYPVPDDERPHAVRFIGATIRGFVELETGGAFDHSPPPSQRSWERALDVIDTALRSWPRGSDRHEA
ncbi:TetR/AcrR family transcriptional regulator [Nocardioides sp. R-C-SC26]|uniref:TetR/AcrR family transcriptional regulator n=1 Tax=Nocardioides sp. R-C-SC26 TaxID=2870414 RepID=UPI001E5068B1|nr:TetR/AcrR family transcriptional regulator [Nocardioides sp. R-C-SC26]